MTRTQILELIPHAGAMCLLDAVLVWDASHIQCRSRSHRDARHPLRRDNRIAPVHLIEYGAQAVAVHGALSAHDRDDSALENGLLAAVRDVTFGTVDNLADIQAPLDIRADCELASASGLIYRFTVAAEQIRLASGRLTIVGR